ncbi:MAG TPA: SUMF1/EgtB/PvdO family nonheme iron enzyme, partial [Chthoniobacterales bacterium]|nr:SUMF1/EgtB/PvdO family nonheme iron enzyme [Chthoniobacterales bacterium]
PKFFILTCLLLNSHILAVGVDDFQKQTPPDLLSLNSRQKDNLGEVDFSHDALDLEFVTIGDSGNASDQTVGYHALGAVDYEYQIGKYEVTAKQYCDFLKAVASKHDPHGLYKTAMSTDQQAACIARMELPAGGYDYAPLVGRGKFPITYVSLYDAERYCNWLENGCPTSEQGKKIVAASTEHGAYLFKKVGDQEMVEFNPEAHYYLPQENEWVKAAYYKGKGKNSGYWNYPTQHNIAPCNGYGDRTNQANYKTPSILWQTKNDGITPVDCFNQSVGSYGTYDMGGNVAEWTSSLNASSLAIVRGGSWKSEYSIYGNNELMRTAPPKSYDPSEATNFIGFRVASSLVPTTQEPSKQERDGTTFPNQNQKDGTGDLITGVAFVVMGGATTGAIMGTLLAGQARQPEAILAVALIGVIIGAVTGVVLLIAGGGLVGAIKIINQLTDQ